MQPYTRTTEYTTAACSLMAAINHLKPDFALSREHEYRIWQASVNLPTRASSIFGLAAFAKRQGLAPRIVVESLDYDYPDYRFKRYRKTDVQQAAFMSGLYRADARGLGVPIEERPIAFEEILALVTAGKTLVLRLNAGALSGTRSVSKYVTLYGKEISQKDTGAHYLLLDPVLAEPLLAVSEEKLREAYETLVTKKKRDHRMIVF